MEVLNENLLFDAEQHSFALEESIQNDQKFYRIRGKFATIEKLNNNKRIYPRALWEREVAKYQSEIENGTVNTLMEWEHPVGRTKVDPKNAVAKIEKLWIEGDYVMGEAVIFDTQQAETIKNMIRHGVKISVSSRATGGVGAGGVVSSFNLITFDIVTNPSDQSATMSGIFESEENSEEAKNMADEKLMENLVSILRTKNVEIRDLNEEIDILRDEIQTIRNHPLYNEMVVSPMHNYGMERHQDVSSTLNDTDPSGYYASGEDHEPVIRRLIDQFNKTDEIGSHLDTDVYIQDRYASINESHYLDDVANVIEKHARVKLTPAKSNADSASGAEYYVKTPSDLKKIAKLKEGSYNGYDVENVRVERDAVIFEINDNDFVAITIQGLNESEDELSKGEIFKHAKKFTMQLSNALGVDISAVEFKGKYPTASASLADFPIVVSKIKKVKLRSYIVSETELNRERDELIIGFETEGVGDYLELKVLRRLNESEDLDNLRVLVESFDSEEYIGNEIMHTLNEASIANIRDFIKVLSKQAGCTVEEHDYSFDGEYPEFVVKDSRDLRKVSQLKPGTYGKVKVIDVEKDPEYVIFELSDGDKVEVIADPRVFESVVSTKPTNRFLAVASHLL